MALILPVRGIYPKFGKNCFFAENATIVGEVEMGDNCSIRFNAVVRGDVHYIKIGNDTNMPSRKIKKVDTELGAVFERTAKNYIKYAE